MKISVLICTYNRPDMLAKCLDALICRTLEKPDEIIIVNGGDERTDELVSSFQKQVTGGIEIKLVKTVNKNLAASRNVGLPHCSGDIIAMTDDDAEVFPDWVAQMKRLHAEHPEAGAVGGAVIGADAESRLSRIADTITFPFWVTPRYARTLPGVNISYKRIVVEQLGLQDETLFRGEDVDYNWRVKNLGYEIYYDPDVRVLHHHRTTWHELLRQQYMYGRAYYLVRSKWQHMYSIYPHSLRNGRDIVKAMNFALAPFYLPLLAAHTLEDKGDRLLAVSLLFAAEIVWRAGMIRQRVMSH